MDYIQSYLPSKPCSEDESFTMAIVRHWRIDAYTGFDPRILDELLVLLGSTQVEILAHAVCSCTLVAFFAILLHEVYGVRYLRSIEVLMLSVVLSSLNEAESGCLTLRRYVHANAIRCCVSHFSLKFYLCTRISTRSCGKMSWVFLPGIAQVIDRCVITAEVLPSFKLAIRSVCTRV